MMTWQHISECVWRITDDGCLEIAPADGKFGFLAGGEETHHDVSHRDLVFFDWPWLSYGPHIFSAKILPGVNVTGSLGFMFKGCTSLKTVDLSGLDTSNVTSMAGMFYYCKSLVDLDLSSFDTSFVTSACSMFEECTSLTSLDLSIFNKTSVVDMSRMFLWCSSLTSLNLSNFDTSNVTDMSHMFAYCSSLTSLDLSSFDTSKVTDMLSMFAGCSSLASPKLSSFDTSKVSDMHSMFLGCSSLTSLNLSNFDTSNVTDMSHMFAYCSSLTSLDLSSFDTSKVTDMRSMFAGSPNAPLQTEAGRLIEKIPDDSSHQSFAFLKNLKKVIHRRGTKKPKKQEKTHRSWNIGGVIFCFIMFGLPLGYICTQCVFANFVNNQSATNNADSETSISEDVDKQTDTSSKSSADNEKKTTEENNTDKEEYTDSEVGFTVSLPSYWIESDWLENLDMLFDYDDGDDVASITCNTHAKPSYISKQEFIAEIYSVSVDDVSKKKLSSGSYYLIPEDNGHSITYATFKNDYLVEFTYFSVNEDAPKFSDFEDMVDSASFSKSDSKKSSGSKSSNSSSKSNKPDGAIDWSEASNHVGETVTVYGKVKDTDYATSSDGRPTFIDIGASYPDSSRVTAVIWEEDRSAFSSSPESYYEGKTVCVTGEIYLYEGVCDIKVTSPSQIEVLD